MTAFRWDTVLAGIIALALVVAAAIRGAPFWEEVPPSSVVAGEPSQGADPEAVALQVIGQQAMQRASRVAADAVLRQVDVLQPSGDVVFSFVTGHAKELQVRAVSPSAPSDTWDVRESSPSPLSARILPDLELGALRVGPTRVLRDLTGWWAGCAPGTLMLSGEGTVLTWHGFCTLLDGRVAMGTVDGRTGVFEPSPAPPALPPATASPSK